MILLSHPTGNQNIRNAAAGLLQRGLLGEFWTCVAWDSRSRWNRLLPGGVRAQLERRRFPEVPPEAIRTVPWLELGRFVAPRLGLKSWVRHEAGICSVDSVFRSFDGRVASHVRRARHIDAVYSGED